VRSGDARSVEIRIRRSLLAMAALNAVSNLDMAGTLSQGAEEGILWDELGDDWYWDDYSAASPADFVLHRLSGRVLAIFGPIPIAMPEELRPRPQPTPSVTRQCKCTYRPRSLRNRWTAVNTPACNGSTEARLWRSFTDRRMSCITARARLSATLARSAWVVAQAHGHRPLE